MKKKEVEIIAKAIDPFSLTKKALQKAFDNSLPIEIFYCYRVPVGKKKYGNQALYDMHGNYKIIEMSEQELLVFDVDRMTEHTFYIEHIVNTAIKPVLPVIREIAMSDIIAAIINSRDIEELNFLNDRHSEFASNRLYQEAVINKYNEFRVIAEL